jgi:hypothetical protein
MLDVPCDRYRLDGRCCHSGFAGGICPLVEQSKLDAPDDAAA